MRESLQNGKTSGGPPSHPSNKWPKVRIFMDSWAVGNGLAGGMGKRHEDGNGPKVQRSSTYIFVPKRVYSTMV